MINCNERVVVAEKHLMGLKKELDFIAVVVSYYIVNG